MFSNQCNSQLLRDFDFQLVNPSTPFKEDSYVLWRQTDMHVRVSRST